MNPTPSEFRSSFPVRFGEIDRAGIVYYPNFFHYYHMAFEEFFATAHGTPYSAWINDRKIGFPTVHVEGDFYSPLVYGDTAIVKMRVAKFGSTSLTFAFQIEQQSNNGVRVSESSRAQITKVCVDLTSMRPTPIPTDLRAILCQYLIADGSHESSENP